MVHPAVVTVNDYLAQRDAEWMGQIHRFLGLSVGLIQVSSMIQSCCYCHIVAFFFSDLFITATSAVLLVLVSKGCLYYIELVLLCTFLDVDAFFSCSQGCTLGKEKLPMHVISPTQTILYVALTFSRMNATKAL
jgi:hypothetical protein